MLPGFAYHPDPLATGSVKVSESTCVYCGEARGYTYVGPVFCAESLGNRPCPWCIADGSFAARYEAEFTDLYDVPSTVSMETIEIISRRTPGFSSWQDGRWLFHCGDGAAFLGPVGARELAAFPDATEMLRHEASEGWPPNHVEDFITALDKDGDPTAYLFRCRKCGTHLAYADYT
ncbi:CbrC family protein [Microbispora sp. H11081]|uniref:CbrC family protein n=1 Tax=Microbispora sp. H11081 TaxID=2729107 RepID=UPI001473BA36